MISVTTETENLVVYCAGVEQINRREEIAHRKKFGWLYFYVSIRFLNSKLKELKGFRVPYCCACVVTNFA